ASVEQFSDLALNHPAHQYVCRPDARKGGKLLAFPGAAMFAAIAMTSTISSWGGAFQKAKREAWFNLVEKVLGITIKENTTSGVADSRAQVASGRPIWDLSTQGTYTSGILEKEASSRSSIPPSSTMPGSPRT